MVATFDSSADSVQQAAEISERLTTQTCEVGAANLNSSFMGNVAPKGAFVEPLLIDSEINLQPWSSDSYMSSLTGAASGHPSGLPTYRPSVASNTISKADGSHPLLPATSSSSVDVHAHVDGSDLLAESLSIQQPIRLEAEDIAPLESEMRDNRSEQSDHGTPASRPTPFSQATFMSQLNRPDARTPTDSAAPHAAAYG
eukprot:CAMPEP_0172162510 /NCGR_PEP_ID=MMETSP1050-20130122/6713_1 /TAXON_ID=233186 /ORGANISM="Cryptomonas curvata, Strain CCAP979/52" /LENGTH=198 /DNA_ID=CAMNT_0012832511 /DNA_START=331 /DNA_END=923 /DNA_ORIENTATION=+